ncbi:MAG: capsular biosynthesis protein [Dehalococcoidia bacterium]|nr:capsular biosynthesis protein [Dehalococcoidia bacterium]
MIDIHCHIMPSLDDGPSTMEESINMARIAIEDGISVVVATPHNRDLGGKNLSRELPNRVNEFNRILESASIPLKVLYGMENHIEMDIITQLNSLEALPIEGTRFMLLELPFEFFPVYTNEIIADLFAGGITPIIVHPERNASIRSDIGLLRDMVNKGCIAQVSSGSISGIHGSLVRDCARDFILQNLVHVLSTDAHSDRGNRTPKLSYAEKLVADIIGSDVAYKMVKDIPLAIINDDISAINV